MTTMNRRSAWFALGSGVAGLTLLLALVKLAHVDLRGMVSTFASFDRTAFAKLAALMAVNSLLSSQKWRLIDNKLRGKDDREQCPVTSFGVTSIGVALGQILPVQLSVSLARTFGAWANGRAVRRGAIGTLFEQAFDFLVVCFLAAASVGVLLLKGGPTTWFVLASMLFATSLVVVSLAMKVAKRLEFEADPQSRWRKFVGQVKESGLLDPILGQQLIWISLLRFGVLVLMAGQTTKAIHSYVPLWHFACAMPFVVIASSIGTPGGLGLNELAYATTLNAMGAPLGFSARWAIANRVLTSAGAFAVAGFALVLLGSLRLARGASTRKQDTDRQACKLSQPELPS